MGESQNKSLEKKIFIQIIDFSWRSHLQYLEQLRQVIGLRQYGQKDPLSEFKKEAYVLFESLNDRGKPLNPSNPLNCAEFSTASGLCELGEVKQNN